MRSVLTCIAAMAFSATFVAAQASSTLPSGFDTKEGTDVPGTTNSYVWSGFGIGSSYVPARALHRYGRKVFPWAPTSAKVITKISVRRDGVTPSTTTPAHTKSVRVIVSNSSTPGNFMDTNQFESNHGAVQVDAVGSKGSPVTVSFPATAKPTTGTAPFNITYPFAKPFVVLAKTATLVVEIRVYKASITAGTFYADAVRYPGTTYNGGSYSVFNSVHCMAPNIYYTSRVNVVGGTFTWIWRTYRPNDLTIAWLGTRRATGIKFGSCNLWVNPMIVALFKNGPSSYGTAILDFGTIPNEKKFIGMKISHQAAVFELKTKKLPFTRPVEHTLGVGYGPESLCTAVYSHGTASAYYNGSVKPDSEHYARYFYRRVPILKIN